MPPSTSKLNWSIPAWILALAGLIVLLILIACFILFWPRHPGARLAGPVRHHQSTAHLPPLTSSKSANAVSAQQQSPQTPQSQPVLPPPPVAITVPADTVIAVRTGELIDSQTNEVGNRFQGTVVSPIAIDGQTVVPQGSAVELILVDKKKTGFFHRSLQMKLALTGVSVNGRIYRTQAGVLSVKPGEQNNDGNDNGNGDGKKALVVMPNTELTFTLTAPFTVKMPADSAPAK